MVKSNLLLSKVVTSKLAHSLERHDVIAIKWLVLVSPQRDVLMSSLSDAFLCSKDCKP